MSKIWKGLTKNKIKKYFFVFEVSENCSYKKHIFFVIQEASDFKRDSSVAGRNTGGHLPDAGAVYRPGRYPTATRSRSHQFTQHFGNGNCFEVSNCLKNNCRFFILNVYDSPLQALRL